MTTSLPSQSPIFTPEQRRMLGQAYNLILSWRNENKNPVPTSSEAITTKSNETIQPDRSVSGESDDRHI
jgi:hypothetical protein